MSEVIAAFWFGATAASVLVGAVFVVVVGTGVIAVAASSLLSLVCWILKADAEG